MLFGEICDQSVISSLLLFSKLSLPAVLINNLRNLLFMQEQFTHIGLDLRHLVVDDLGALHVRLDQLAHLIQVLPHHLHHGRACSQDTIQTLPLNCPSQQDATYSIVRIEITNLTLRPLRR